MDAQNMELLGNKVYNTCMAHAWMHPHTHALDKLTPGSCVHAQACSVVLRVVKSRGPLLQVGKLLYRLSKDSSNDALFKCVPCARYRDCPVLFYTQPSTCKHTDCPVQL